MTAVVERTDKWQVHPRPRSGADLWLVSPADEKGRPKSADLHVSLAEAEEVAYLLLQAVDDARQAQ